MKNNDNNMINRLYDLLQESMDYKIHESEILRAKEQITETLSSKKANIKYEDIEYAVLDYGIAYERAGFWNGFVIAVRIMSECISADYCAIRDIPECPSES